MKRIFIFLLIIGALSGVGASASAENMRLCVFTDTGVITHADGLATEILIDKDEMVIAPGEASEQRVALATVTAIAYSEGVNGATGLADENLFRVEAVTVYDLSGTPCGRYDSAADAVKDLPTGVYIIKSETFTLKIRIK